MTPTQEENDALEGNRTPPVTTAQEEEQQTEDLTHEELPAKMEQTQYGSRCAMALWEERERLQALLAEERQQRQSRETELATLDEAIRALRAELVAERKLLALAEDDRLAAYTRAHAAERSLLMMQEEHQHLRARHAEQEATLKRHQAAAAAAEQEKQQACENGAWARDGPETDALKDAKLELAEILSATDEAKLLAKRQSADLRREIELARAEGQRLRENLELQQNAPFGASVWRFMRNVLDEA